MPGFPRLFGAAVAAALSLLRWPSPRALSIVLGSQAYAGAANITQQRPGIAPRRRPSTLFFRVSFQFTYDKVCICATDGTDPAGVRLQHHPRVLTNDAGTITLCPPGRNGTHATGGRAPISRRYGRTPKEHQVPASGLEALRGRRGLRQRRQQHAPVHQQARLGGRAGPSPGLAIIAGLFL